MLAGRTPGSRGGHAQTDREGHNGRGCNEEDYSTLHCTYPFLVEVQARRCRRSPSTQASDVSDHGDPFAFLP
jgi:hypothetical protein